MSESVLIPARFNGPLQSGNGGYGSGALAAFLDDAVEVSLRRPVPLGKADGPFSNCFVCSRGREDTLGVHAGAVEGRGLVASPWARS